MDQIYYTQCPMGYGQGASNGFQVKRASPNYPQSADFRFLNMRPYPAGGRTLAPTTLRYRLVDGIAEVARLTPRKSEYETERGPWGRPGGLFTHGVRLDTGEQGALHHWFAGLSQSERWVSKDLVRSAGMTPPELVLSPEDFQPAYRFEAVARLADGLSSDFLAKLWTALAEAVRKSQTVYFLDALEKSADRVALLTFAIPEPLRAALTFSTFHDRPEELPGLRLSGTTANVRPNRPALLAQGFIADFASETIEPRVEPAPWAVTLAEWFTRRSSEDEQAWEATERLACQVLPGWTEEELDALFAYHLETLDRLPRPDSPEAWKRLERRIVWISSKGLGGNWAATHGPLWWSEVVEGCDEAVTQALAAALALPESWTPGVRVAEWGKLVARLPFSKDREEGLSRIAEVLKHAPRGARPGFLQSLVAALPVSEADWVVDRLRADRSQDGAALLPIRATGAVRLFLQGKGFTELEAILRQAKKIPGTFATVLDSCEIEALKHEGGLGRVAALIVPALLSHPEALSWFLKREDRTSDWLARPLRPTLAIDNNQETWEHLKARTSLDDRPALARVFLETASDAQLPAESFLWGVENLLIPLDIEARPRDPAWPGLYLDRTAGDFRLIQSLVQARADNRELRRWMSEAVENGQVGDLQRARLNRLNQVVKAIRSGNGAEVTSTRLETFSKEDRPALLGWALKKITVEPGFFLNACGRCWPELTEGGPETLMQFGERIADWPELNALKSDPESWVEKLAEILSWLGDRRGFGPDGIAAAVVAATSRDSDHWEIRQALFDRSPDGFRSLCEDFRQNIHVLPLAHCPRVVEEWDRRIEKAGGRSERFWELVLNGCASGLEGDDARFVAVVAARVGELRSFDRLEWWNPKLGGEVIPNMREAFARLAPAAPWPLKNHAVIEKWVFGAKPENRQTRNDDPLPVRTASDRIYLSAFAKARVSCILAVTKLFDPGMVPYLRSLELFKERKSIPLEKLDEGDRTNFVAWMIRGFEDQVAIDIPPFAKWLFRDLGFRDFSVLKHWEALTETENLNELTGDDTLTVEGRKDRDDLVGKIDQEIRILEKESQESETLPQRR